MPSVVEIGKRARAYLANFDDNVDEVLNSPQVEEQLTQLNRRQMLLSVGGDGKALIHQKTGSPLLSKAYAKRMRKQYPNIYVNGNYQGEMFTETRYKQKNYLISSLNRLVKYLPFNYKNLHGIAPSNQPLAQQVTSEAISKDINSKVLS